MGIKLGTFNGRLSNARCSMRQGDEDEEVAAADRSVVRDDSGPGALPGEKVAESGYEVPR